MGARMRAYDWSSSPLGSPSTWPQSLRVTIRLMLNTRHPMFIWWGPDLIQFYNDAYRETMGPEKHPGALGGKGRETWAEIWDIIGPQIEHVMAGKGATWHEDHLVPVTRHGRREDVWWTYSFGPIDHDDGVGGVLVVCKDVTAEHLAKLALQRQTERLNRLFEDAPSFMAVLRGPDHVFEFTNAAYRRLVGHRDLTGQSVREALPEIERQGFIELLDEVRRSGRAYVGSRVPLTLDSKLGGPRREIFLDFIYQPIVEASGEVSGIFVEGSEVTEHVRAEEYLRLINEELKHRVKNTLAMVNAIATQTLRGKVDRTAFARFRERIGAFGSAHDIVTSSASSTAALREVIEGVLAPHRTHADRMAISGPPIAIGGKQAVSIALAIHELATNAAKYGALSNSAGRVRLDWQIVDGNGEPLFSLVWRESDGPAVRPPQEHGFGTLLLKRVLEGDLGGQVELGYDPSGLTCRLTTPASNLVDKEPPRPGSGITP